VLDPRQRAGCRTTTGSTCGGSRRQPAACAGSSSRTARNSTCGVPLSTSFRLPRRHAKWRLARAGSRYRVDRLRTTALQGDLACRSARQRTPWHRTSWPVRRCSAFGSARNPARMVSCGTRCGGIHQAEKGRGGDDGPVCRPHGQLSAESNTRPGCRSPTHKPCREPPSATRRQRSPPGQHRQVWQYGKRRHTRRRADGHRRSISARPRPSRTWRVRSRPTRTAEQRSWPANPTSIVQAVLPAIHPRPARGRWSALHAWLGSLAIARAGSLE
jgi:hypothetical protein